MDISFFEIKKLAVDKIHPIQNKYCRTFRIETKEGEKLNISIFSSEIDDLIIKKEE
jgi:hypothetical protein